MNKVDDLAGVLELHPLTLLILSYANGGSSDLSPRFMEAIMAEVNSVLNFNK